MSINGAEGHVGVKIAAYSDNVVGSNKVSKFEYSVRIENIENAIGNKDGKTVSAYFVNITENLQSFDVICTVYDGKGALLGIEA